MDTLPIEAYQKRLNSQVAREQATATITKNGVVTPFVVTSRWERSHPERGKGEEMYAIIGFFLILIAIEFWYESNR